MRAFLANYLANEEHPQDINNLGNHAPLAIVRKSFDDMLQIDSTCLTADEIDHLRPLYFRTYASELQSDSFYFKTHHSYYTPPDGEPIFPADVTAGVIYIVRNPLDVAISYANHNQVSIDRSIELMEDDQHALASYEGSIVAVLPDRMGTWSQHVEGWVNQTTLPMLVVRYEDMTANPTETFGQVLRFMGYEPEPERLDKALRFSSFRELKKQEMAAGFLESPTGLKSFFRKGQSGDWKQTLSTEQIDRIVSIHHRVMTRFQYWPFQGA